MTQDHTLGWLIEQARSWETAAHDLYAAWAQDAPVGSSSRELWTAMSRDEAMHAALLGTLRASMSEERLATPLSPEDLAMVDAVDALLARVGTMPLESVDDAYEAAHALESSEVNAVFTLVLTRALEGDERRALVHLLTEDHVNRLYRFGDLHDREHRRSLPLRTA